MSEKDYKGEEIKRQDSVLIAISDVHQDLSGKIESLKDTVNKQDFKLINLGFKVEKINERVSRHGETAEKQSEKIEERIQNIENDCINLNIFKKIAEKVIIRMDKISWIFVSGIAILIIKDIIRPTLLKISSLG